VASSVASLGEPRHGGFGGGYGVLLGRKNLALMKSDSEPAPLVLDIAAVFLEPESALRSHEDVHASCAARKLDRVQDQVVMCHLPGPT
jgi:hypothetical protein